MSELHLEVSGTGPDVVLLHGWGLNLRVWDELVTSMRDRFRLIAVDLPGHGRSPWTAGSYGPAEHAWMVHQSVARFSTRYSLIGWSLGAQIALDLAAATPAQVERLVLVAATPRFTWAQDWPHGAAPETLHRLERQLRLDYRRTLADFLDLQVRGSADAPLVLERLRASLFRHGDVRPVALGAGLDILAVNDLRSALGHVQAPALVVAGHYDRIISPEASRALAELLGRGPGGTPARYVEMPRAAHAPFLSHSREFAQLVEGFLTQPPQSRAAQANGVQAGTAEADQAPAGAAPARTSRPSKALDERGPGDGRTRQPRPRSTKPAKTQVRGIKAAGKPKRAAKRKRKAAVRRKKKSRARHR